MSEITSQLFGIAQDIIHQLKEIVRQLKGIKENDSRANRKEESYHGDPKSDVSIPPTRVVINSLPPLSQDEIAYRKEKRCREKDQFSVERGAFFVLILYTVFTGYQTCLTRTAIRDNEDSFQKTLRLMEDTRDDSAISAGDTLLKMQAQTRAQQSAANATKAAADTAAASLVLGQRPWVKIKHRIIRPLAFGVPAWKGPVASATIEDTLENVGQSVALNVVSWEDIIPLDADYTFRTAEARQNQWCDSNRHRSPRALTGYMLFPKDPWVQHSGVGPSMETVMNAAAASGDGLTGKVGFVLVGCVCYRSSFEPQTSPAHETRFMYFLGKPEDGGFNPYVIPSGIATELQLMVVPNGFSAD